MFKAAFPYAQQEEELAEKEYLKGMENTSSEEVAGNVWIHPDQGTLHYTARASKASRWSRKASSLT